LAEKIAVAAVNPFQANAATHLMATKAIKIISSRPRWMPVLLTLVALLIVFASGCQTAPPNSLATHNSSIWRNAIAAYEANDQTNPPPKNGIVFVGSSSILKWKTLAADFPDLPVINRGFGGSQLADAVNFADRIVIKYQPREVVVYAGGNDLNAGKSPEMVYGDFVALMRQLHAGLPHAQLAFISSAPNLARWSQVEKVKRLNLLAENYCRHHDIFFINVFPLMLGTDGKPKPDIYVADGLHMNAKGYAIWRAAVAPYLK
jgi:lysophospholipase L1-like esterase